IGLCGSSDFHKVQFPNQYKESKILSNRVFGGVGSTFCHSSGNRRSSIQAAAFQSFFLPASKITLRSESADLAFASSRRSQKSRISGGTESESPCFCQRLNVM